MQIFKWVPARVEEQTDQQSAKQGSGDTANVEPQNTTAKNNAFETLDNSREISASNQDTTRDKATTNGVDKENINETNSMDSNSQTSMDVDSESQPSEQARNTTPKLADLNNEEIIKAVSLRQEATVLEELARVEAEKKELESKQARESQEAALAAAAAAKEAEEISKDTVLTEVKSVSHMPTKPEESASTSDSPASESTQAQVAEPAPLEKSKEDSKNSDGS